MNLTQAELDKLNGVLGKLGTGLAVIHGAVEEYSFPNPYAELTALMEQQKVCVMNVLEGRELGCELADLDPDFKKIISKAHIKNLAFTAASARQIPDEEPRQVFVDARTFALHEIKNVASFASLAYMHLSHILEPMGEKRV